MIIPKSIRVTQYFEKKNRVSGYIILFFFLLFAIKSFGYALAEDSLEPFGANPSDPYTNSTFYDSTKLEYVFTHLGNEDSIKYSLLLNDYSTQHGLIKIRVNINGSSDVYPVNWGGSRYRSLSGALLEPSEFADVAQITLVNHFLSNGVATFEYQETYEDVTNTKTIQYWIKGKTLIFHIFSSNTESKGNYYGFNFDRSENTLNPRAIEIPYTIDPIVTFDDKYFYSVYLDRSKSNSAWFNRTISDYSSTSIYCSFVSLYGFDSEGKVPPLNETGYVTVSKEVIDVIPKPNHEPSPYRDLLNDKVVLDLWGAPFGRISYRTYEDILKELHQFGLTNLAVIYHHWTRYGWDTKLPSHYPANPDWGTEAELKSLIRTAKEYGHFFALNEKYWFMRPDSPYYDENDIAKNADLSLRTGLGEHTDKLIIASDKMIKYADLEANKIKTNYQTNASFLDVNPAWNPEALLRQIDFDASNPNSRCLSQIIRNNKNLFQHQQNLYQGPLFGEGGVRNINLVDIRFDSYYAGYVDGVERQLEGRYLAEIIPDFELLAVKPLMANHGMGYPARYFNKRGEPAIDADRVNWDLYRATEIAYGHAGYLTGLGISSEERDPYVHRYPLGSLERALVEYYMLQQLQSQYLSGDATIILYEDAGQMVGLSQALINDIDFVNAKLYIEYDNGLKLYVNHDQADNWIVNLEGMSYDLPSNGWVASNSNLNFLEYSAIVDNNRIDYVNSPAYTFARSRTGALQIIGDLTTNGTVAFRDSELTNLREIHMVNTSVVDYTQAPYGIISTSTKCNLNLVYLDNYKFQFSTSAIQTGASVEITYKDVPSTWRDSDGDLPLPASGVINVWVIDLQGNPIVSIPWTRPTGKEIKIGNVLPDAIYRVIFDPSLSWNSPPILSAISDVSFPEDDTLTINLSDWYVYVEDPDDPDSTLTWVIEDKANVFTVINEGVITFTAPKDWFGVDTLSVIVRDRDSNDTTSVAVVVIPINDPPVIIAPSPNTTMLYNNTLRIDLNDVVEDVDDPDSTLTWSAISSNDSLFISIDNENIATFTALKFTGDVKVMLTVTDDSLAYASDTLIVRVTLPVAVDEGGFASTPKEFSLLQNYPNPFNSETTIKFQLPEESHVILKIHNILGQEIKTLVNEQKPAGFYHATWNGTDNQGKKTSSGIYFYQIEAGDYTKVKKLIILQ